MVAEAAKNGRVFDEERAANQRHTHHFVSVPTDAVGVLDAIHQPTMFGGKQARAPPRSVDMKPQTFAMSNGGEGVQIVVSPAYRGGGCCHDT